MLRKAHPMLFASLANRGVVGSEPQQDGKLLPSGVSLGFANQTSLICKHRHVKCDEVCQIDALPEYPIDIWP